MIDLTPYQDPLTIQRVLHNAKTIAIVGLSGNELRASHFVGYYARRHGYRVIPVNPRETQILGEPCYKSLLDVPVHVDIVDVFRAPDAVPGIAKEAVAIHADVLWCQFGVVNAAYTGALNVLGPAVAKQHLRGAAGWAGVLVAVQAGLIASGLVLLRWRPRRLLRTATFGSFGLALPLFALARPEPLVVVIVAAFASGYLSEIFGVLWDTTYQQEIPPDKLSRLSAYDAIGSWALMPLGFAVAGPVGAAVGPRATFLGAGAVIVVASALVLLSRDVRTLERR